MRSELQTLHAAVPTIFHGRRTWDTRISVRLILDDEAGHVGLGEAAPLPGVSRDTAARARRALSRVKWPDAVPATLAEVQEIVETIDPGVPSARFAAETALASLTASIRQIPLWGLYSDEVPNAVTNAVTLWGGDVESVSREAADAAAGEVATVLLHVGRSDQKLEQSMLEAVRKHLPRAELRLDSSRRLARSGTGSRLQALSQWEPAFVEEACALDAMLALDDPAVPLALDESLRTDAESTLERALTCDGIAAVVLKPTMLGGLERCRRLAQRARKAGRKAVVSHALEGCIARAAAAHLALALDGAAPSLGDHPALAALSDGLTVGWIDDAWIEAPELPGLGLELAW